MMQLPCAGGGKGRRPGWAALWTLYAASSCVMQLPYAGGGKGLPSPLHPRPGALPLGTPK
jgi:hypothetical protein